MMMPMSVAQPDSLPWSEGPAVMLGALGGGASHPFGGVFWRCGDGESRNGKFLGCTAASVTFVR